MARRKNAIHLDAKQRTGELGASLCGWLAVQTTEDIAAVTCRSCLARLRSGTCTGAALRLAGTFSVASFAQEIHAALELAQEQQRGASAGAPPRLSPQAWAASCKGGEHRRCAACAICEWEREASKWAAVAPWNESEATPDPESNAPRWGSLNGALRAMVQHERTGRDIGSALGRDLTRMQLGLSRTVSAHDGSTRESRRADDVLLVSRAFEHAYEGGFEGLSAKACQQVMLDRTPGIRERVVLYEALAERYGVAEDALRRVVRHGRAFIAADLERRGLVRPRSARRGEAASKTLRRVPATMSADQ